MILIKKNRLMFRLQKKMCKKRTWGAEEEETSENISRKSSGLIPGHHLKIRMKRRAEEQIIKPEGEQDEEEEQQSVDTESHEKVREHRVSRFLGCLQTLLRGFCRLTFNSLDVYRVLQELLRKS